MTEENTVLPFLSFVFTFETHTQKETLSPKKKSKKEEKEVEEEEKDDELKKKNTPSSFSARPAQALRVRDHLLERDLRVLPPEVVVLGQEEHAVALLPLAHRDAGAVPKALSRLGLLVVVVPARAQRGAELVLVLGEALDHDGGDGLIDAEVGAGAVRRRWRRFFVFFEEQEAKKKKEKKRVSIFFFFFVSSTRSLFFLLPRSSLSFLSSLSLGKRRDDRKRKK